MNKKLFFNLAKSGKSIMLMLFMLVGFLNSFAGIETFNARVASPNIAIGTIVKTQDDRYTSVGSNLFFDKKISNRVIFSIDQAKVKFQTGAFSITIAVDVECKKWNGSAFIPQLVSKNLTINYDPTNNYQDKVAYEFFGGNALSAKITAITITPGTIALSDLNLALETEIEIERYYKFDPSFVPTVISHNSNNLLTRGELDIWWDAIPGAEEYDLEWLYVNNYDLTTVIIPNISSREFQFNSTRITTTALNYSLPYIYGSGYILYRVRGVGKTSGDNYAVLKAGNWSTDASGFTFTNADNFPNRFPIKSNCPYFSAAYNTNEAFIAHEDHLNWQFSVSYAEEGKSKAVVSYFDGSLRNRQSVTKSKTNDKIIVGESIYDFQGRPAVQVLPVPVNNSKIDYTPNFNLNETGQPYSKLDFDTDLACVSNTNPMSTSSGASNYYSTVNPDKQAQQAYVPDAEKYPFTQVNYTPDNTGRIRSQSGVGSTFKLGTDHETKYFYGTPFQEELDNLFGSEVGDAVRYKKNMVRDANGQLSVSYLDPQGRVIATSLTGAVPLNVNALSGINWMPMTIDLLDKNNPSDITGSTNLLDLSKRSLTLSDQIMVGAEALRTFKYKTNGNKVDVSCSTKSICYDCVLDLNIHLTDDCNTEYLTGLTTDPNSTSKTIGTNTGLSNCSPTSIPNFDKGYSGVWQTNAPLKVGTFNLSKTLTVNKTALDAYTKDYLTNNSCLFDLQHFINATVSEINFTSCNMTCDQCVTLLGDYSKYDKSVSPNCDPCMSQNDWQALKDRCLERCANKSVKCDAGLQMMTSDMSPNGQYGFVMENVGVTNGVVSEPNLTEPLSSAYVPGNSILSVYNTSNKLPVKASIYDDYVNTPAPKNSTDAYSPSWRYPYNPNQTGEKRFTYLDEQGNIALVSVTGTCGNYTPAVVAGHCAEPMAGGRMGVRPQFLANFSDLMDGRWEPIYANALVVYHPEYGYYKYCTTISTSNDFDETWIGFDAITDASAKWGALFLDPISNNIDPYFTSANPLRASDPAYFQKERDAMINGMNHYTSKTENGVTTSISIWQAALLTNNNPTAGSMGCAAATISTNINDINTDDEWNVFKGMYLSLKQKIQQQTATKFAINGGYYNGCIGKETFDPFQNNFFEMYHGITGWFRSQYFNQEQPCFQGNAQYYHDKSARFPGISDMLQIGSLSAGNIYDQNEKYGSYEDIHTANNFEVVDSPVKELAIIAEGKKQADLALYKSCGICPNAQRLEMMLNALITKPVNDQTTATNFFNSGVNLTCYPAGSIYPEFTTDLGQALNFNPLSNVTYNYDSQTGGIYTAHFQSGAQSSTLKLKMTTEATTTTTSDVAATLAGLNLYSFSDIQKICCLKYNAVSTIDPTANGKRSFRMIATVLLKPLDPLYDAIFPNRYRELVVEGLAGFDVGGCTFDPICKPSKEALQVQNLLNALVYRSSKSPAINQSFTSTAAVSLNPEPFNAVFGDLKTKFDAVIAPAVNAGVNTVWTWVTLPPVNGVLTAYVNASGQQGTCSFTFTMPPETSFTFDQILQFSNINIVSGGSSNDFTINALVSTGTSANPASPQYITLTGHSSCLSMGVCDNALPPYLVQAQGKQVQTNGELVVNGDFEHGNTGFLTNISNYSISATPPDHSSGSGSSLFFNQQFVYGKTFWSNTTPITVLPNTNYLFSVWVKYIGGDCGNTGNQIVMQVNGITYSIAAVNISSNWINITANYFSGATTQINLAIVSGFSDCIYSLAFDDISLKPLCPTTEMVINGNFSQGNTGFTSSRNYNNNCLMDKSSYYNIKTPLNCASNDYMPADHTNPGSGNYLYVYDESYETGILWKQTISGIQPNTNYKFSFWYQYGDYVQSSIGGDTLFVTGPIINYSSGSWINSTRIWNSGNNTGTVDISISTQISFLYLDDISFKVVNTDCTLDPPSVCMCDITSIPWPEIVVDTNPCATELMNIATNNGKQRFNTYIDGIKQQFQEKYISKCLNVYEEFFMNYQDSEHHFTLYYYDQGGNLVRTIPPAGVVRVNSNPSQTQVISDMAQIKSDRANGTHTYFTKHILPTTYKYNSLNQLKGQSMPDNENLAIFEASKTATGIPATHIVSNTAFSDAFNGLAFTKDANGVGHIFTTSTGGTSWSETTNIGIVDLNDVQITDALTAYTIGKNGTVLKTTNGGIAWNPTTPPTVNELFRLHMLTNTAGFVFEKSGVRWETADGGATWLSSVSSLKNILGTANLTDISFNDSDHGIAVTDAGTIYSTNDGGLLWAAMNNIRTVDQNKVISVNGLRLSIGKDGSLIKSSDLGATWKEIPNNLKKELKTLYFSSTSIGWVLDVDGNIFKTTNGGTTFTAETTPVGQFTDMYFTSASHGYAATAAGQLSAYNGSSWNALTTGNISGINKIVVDNSTTPEKVYIVGNTVLNLGQVYESSNGGGSWTSINLTGLIGENIVDGFFTNISNIKKGVVLAASGKIYSYSSGIFSQVTSLTKVYTALHFTDATHGYAISQDGYLATYNASNSTWSQSSQVINPGTNNLKSVFMNNESNGLYGTAVGTNGELWYISDVINGSWSSASNAFTPPALYAVTKVDANNAIAVGVDGTIVKTTDNINWQMQITGTNKNLYDISLNNSLAGAAVGEAGAILTTVNSLTWLEQTVGTSDFKSAVFTASNSGTAVGNACSGTSITSGGNMAIGFPISTDNLLAIYKNPSSSDMFAIGQKGKIFKINGVSATQLNQFNPAVINDSKLANNKDGYAVGAGGAILTTSDGGNTWVAQASPTTNNLNAVYAFGATNAIAVGDAGTVLKTTNSGVTWLPVTGSFGTTKLNDIYFSDFVGFIVGNGGNVFVSTSTGAIWTAVSNTNTSQNLNAVYMVDKTTAFACGDNGTVLKIYNLITCTLKAQPIAQILNDVYFVDYMTGYVVGNNGAMFKTLNGGDTWTSQNLNDPNPATTDNYKDITALSNGSMVIAGANGNVSKLKDLKDMYASLFYYDKLGRMIVSQNSKQFNKTTNHLTYSYTLYDALGRIMEVGEIAAGSSIEGQYDSGVLDDNKFAAWINSGIKTEITHTYYDYQAFATLPVTQENLRKRVASVTFENSYDGNTQTYNHATHYSYDIHGNVKLLLQDNPVLDAVH